MSDELVTPNANGEKHSKQTAPVKGCANREILSHEKKNVRVAALASNNGNTNANVIAAGNAPHKKQNAMRSSAKPCKNVVNREPQRQYVSRKKQVAPRNAIRTNDL